MGNLKRLPIVTVTLLSSSSIEVLDFSWLRCSGGKVSQNGNAPFSVSPPDTCTYSGARQHLSGGLRVMGMFWRCDRAFTLLMNNKCLEKQEMHFGAYYQ